MALLPVAHIQRKIYFVRDQKVMLDHDLADLYGVTTKRLNEQVKRNRERFPKTFMFQLNPQETDMLIRSQMGPDQNATFDTVRLSSPSTGPPHGRIAGLLVEGGRVRSHPVAF